MRIRISFDKDAVKARGGEFVEIECSAFESPKLPAFVHVYDERKPATSTRGYHLVVTEKGTLRASKY
jgi:hypothetical protein